MREPVIVHIPGVLADLFPGLPRRMECPAGSVAAMLDWLDAHHPGLADRIRDERPAIRRHMNIFVDGERADLDSPLPSGADVYILTAISGG